MALCDARDGDGHFVTYYHIMTGGDGKLCKKYLVKPWATCREVNSPYQTFGGEHLLRKPLAS
jgi:hypothetical protein